MPVKLLLLLLFCCNLAHGQLIPPENYQLTRDIVYKKVDNWQGRLDLYTPKNNHRKKPLVIFIHGGGWVHGKKEEEKDFAIFFEKEFVIANVEYRLAGQAPAPSAIEDTRCALAYLLQKAHTYGIDRKKIIVMGVSAGGHLALMTGLTARDTLYSAGCFSKNTPSFSIAAIIERAGPADLNRWETIRKPGKASSAWLGGRENDTAFVHTLSPISYVHKNSPPVFIMHGDKDNTVPYQQSLILLDRLQKADVPFELHTVKGAGHSVSEKDKAALKEEIFRFLKKQKI
ncbi:alpha/beta hydrolase [Paraflavisolibacter sp. H34]|uniref:alpha/beta hydrolase n=1 Tax=Huijunlia imazamoxiresistens TaxID=3127457 RepID=UPI003019659F